MGGLVSKMYVLPFNIKKFNDRFLAVNRLGSWAFLDSNELGLALRSDTSNQKTCDKLISSGLAIDKSNIEKIITDFRHLNANLFQGPSLHIISVSSICNFNCTYCHADAPSKSNPKKLDKETGLKIIQSIFDSNSKAITIEFQGGEPLTNWETVSFVIKHARELNKLEKKDLRITLMSNLSLLEPEHLEFFQKYDVSICTSLDGPKEIHDLNRPFASGAGTFNIVTEKIRKINKNNIMQGLAPMNAVPTITRASLSSPKEIINTYHNLGMNAIHLRYLNYLGVAKDNWDKIGYSAEEFIEFWKKGLDHILDMNKRKIKFTERTCKIILQKILAKKDPMYTELMNPCGAGRSQIVYTENGDVFTCDEGRMLKSDLFKLGNIQKDSHRKLMSSPVIMNTALASFMDLFTPGNPYLPWSGTCPVVNQSAEGSCISKMYLNMRQIIQDAQFDIIFEKILHDKEARKIFCSWVEINPKEIEKYL